MKMGLAILCGVLVAAVLLAGFVLPKHVVIGRRVIIDAPPELVAPDLAAVAAWPDWGTPVIAENDPVKGLKYKLELEGGRYVVDGRVHFTRDGTRTAVAWVDTMDLGHSYVGRYIGATMDLRLGPRIEQSLLELKKRAEERAASKGVVAHSAPPVHDAALTPPPEEKPAPPPGEALPAPTPTPAVPTPAPEQPAPVEAPPPAPAAAPEKPVEKPAEPAPAPPAEPPKAEEAPPKPPEEPAPGP